MYAVNYHFLINELSIPEYFGFALQYIDRHICEGEVAGLGCHDVHGKFPAYLLQLVAATATTASSSSIAGKLYYCGRLAQLRDS